MVRFTLTMTALLAAGCGSDFDEKWELEGYRILGVQAEEPEVGPDDTIRLQVHDFDADEAAPAPEYRWSVCLYSLGALVDFECIDPRLELPMDAEGPTATLDLGPDGLDLRRLYEQVGPLPLPNGEMATFETGFDVWISLVSGPPGGRIVRSVKRVTVRKSNEPRNTNPTIEAFTLDGVDADGTGRTGEEVELEVTPATGSSEPMIGVDGDETTEELLYAFYTTAGDLDPAAGFGEEATTTLTLPDEPGTVTVFVGLRDGRGGLDIARREIVVTP